MGWEKRGKQGHRLVYYRKKRIDGRVVSIYVGPGERGEAAEREDLERRETAKRASEAPEVLQGATPFSGEGATAQTLEHAQDSPAPTPAPAPELLDPLSFEEADEYVAEVLRLKKRRIDLGALISRILTVDTIKNRLREKYLTAGKGESPLATR